MKPTIEVQPLSQKKRQFVFVMSLLLFVLAVPVSVFYAIGYRFDFTDGISSIKSVGGMYVRNDTPNTEMFINDEPVTDKRLFQKAAYIQNLEAGMHRIHVQGDQVQTWVKELPVYAHFVTEVASFNLPKIPQVRLITQWNDLGAGKGVVFDTAATSTYFRFASTTNALRFSSTTATSSLVANPEYLYIKSLFASSTENRITSARLLSASHTKAFTFDVATSGALVETATTTKHWRDFVLYEKGSEVMVTWKGDRNRVPHYYCVTYTGEKKTIAQYGQHVFDTLKNQFASTTNWASLTGERVCRDSIQIDRLGQHVSWFDFFPDSTDIVLMHLDDGLYAVEADDRAWQNSQLLYPGKDLEVIQDGGRIFVHDGDYYLEVFTEIASQ